MPVNKAGTDIPPRHVRVDKSVIFPYAGYAAVLNGYVPNLCALRKYIDDCSPFNTRDAFLLPAATSIIFLRSLYCLTQIPPSVYSLSPNIFDIIIL